MTPTPTGRVERIADGKYDLTLKRSFRAPIADVWASLTESDRTARWFGPWRGDPGSGKVEFQMGFEEGDQWMTMSIDRCDAPRVLEVSAVDEHGSWFLELTLTESDGVTELAFVQHLSETSAVENTGPGWEYYLDLLVSSREGTPQPDFNDYYPAQKEYYEGQAAAAG